MIPQFLKKALHPATTGRHETALEAKKETFNHWKKNRKKGNSTICSTAHFYFFHLNIVSIFILRVNKEALQHKYRVKLQFAASHPGYSVCPPT